MQLDVKTLYLLNIVVALVTAGVSFFSWFYHRDMPGLRGWAIGLSLGAAGTVILSLPTPASPIILAIAGNTLIVAGYATVWMSVRRFNDGALDLRYVTLPVGLFVVFFTIASLAGADIRDRIAMVSTAIGTLSLLAGREVFNARKQEPLGSRLPTSLAFAFIAIAALERVLSKSTPRAVPLMNPAVLLLVLANSYAMIRYTPLVLKEAIVNATTRVPFESAIARQLESYPRGAQILMANSDHIGALQQAGIPLRQTLNEGDRDSWEAALAAPAEKAQYVVAIAGDPVAKAVAEHPEGLTELTVLCTTGQPCARIYKSDRYGLEHTAPRP